MSVLIVTSLGDIVVDLHTDKCPLTSKNFLKLCKIKYYNGCQFHTVQKDFTAQTGDPTGTGTGGDSIYKFLYGDQARFFSDEIHLDLKHSKTGTVAMASAGENLNASQFYFTLRDDLDYLDGKHTVFGEVAEGLETLTRINEAYVDEKGRPFKNIRIKHTYILDDPFDDPSQLAELIPAASPEGKPKDEVDGEVRLEDDWVPMDEQLGPSELEEVLRAKEAHSSAVVLESIGDIPDAEIKPPDNVLFVCKLNPVTEDEDLHTIFSRFGTVLSAEIIRDYKTGDSLCYAFVEFETKESCEQAYFKMDNALIDDRRIHVDFSQSVSKLWSQYRHKDHQMGKGRGCFKCGALDHIAKDCAGGGPGGNQQPPKFILKDSNTQHGAHNSRYEMVFDEDTPESPKREKRHQGRDSDERYAEKKGSTDRHGPSEHSRGDRRDEINRGNASRMNRSRRDQDNLEEPRDREKHREKRRVPDDYRINERDCKNRTLEDDGRKGRKDDTDDERKWSEYGDRDMERRIVGEYGKQHPDNASNFDKKADGDNRKRSIDDRHGKRRNDRDYRNSNIYSDRQDVRNVTSHRKRSADDDDGYKGRREERERGRRTKEDDYDSERRHRGDKRR